MRPSQRLLKLLDSHSPSQVFTGVSAGDQFGNRPHITGDAGQGWCSAGAGRQGDFSHPCCMGSQSHQVCHVIEKRLSDKGPPPQPSLVCSVAAFLPHPPFSSFFFLFLFLFFLFFLCLFFGLLFPLLSLAPPPLLFKFLCLLPGACVEVKSHCWVCQSLASSCWPWHTPGLLA